jgi:hypothetical protein
MKWQKIIQLFASNITLEPVLKKPKNMKSRQSVEKTGDKIRSATYHVLFSDVPLTDPNS